MKPMLIATMLCAWLAAAGPLAAQEAGSTRAAAEPPVTTLRVTPRAQPDPALRYRLLPPITRLRPGNAAVMYLMAGDALHDPQWTDEHQSWLDMPLADLPRDEIDKLVGSAGDLQMLDQAARRSRIEWDNANLVDNGVAALLPHVNQLRALTRRLALRIRLHVARRDYDAAVRDLQTGLALAHHLQEGGTLIETLVGIAIARAMLERIEELVQQPDAPNLYWALTQLPRPLVSVRRGMEFEQHIVGFIMQRFYREHADRSILEQAGAMQDRAGLLVDSLTTWVYGLNVALPGVGEGHTRVRTMAAGIVIQQYPRAKRYLIEEKGMTPQQVEALPVTAVSLTFILDRYRHWRDEMFKWMALPYWQAEPFIADMNERLGAAVTGLEGGWPFTMLLPAVSSALRAQASLDRHVALLRCVEAIRLYAAHHDGRLPASLDALDAPAPIDPMTGKPFDYHAAEGVARLTAPPPRSGTHHDGAVWRIELRPAKP